jgi:hypothetical protein
MASAFFILAGRLASRYWYHFVMVDDRILAGKFI